MIKKIIGGSNNRIVDNEIDVYISIKYIKSSLFSKFLNYLKKTNDDKINRKMLFSLKRKTREIKSKNFTIKDVTFIISDEGNFNGIVVTINTIDKKQNNLEEKKLKLKDLEGSIYKELLLDINENEDENLKNVEYDYIFATTTNIERKKNCIKQANKKKKELCKTKNGKEKNNCYAKEVTIDDCISRCVIPYKKSKFIINNHTADECIVEENR